jgi:hypothetical protein
MRASHGVVQPAVKDGARCPRRAGESIAAAVVADGRASAATAITAMCIAAAAARSVNAGHRFVGRVRATRELAAERIGMQPDNVAGGSDMPDMDRK